LPDSLENAIALAEKSKLLKRVLGDHVFDKLIENKKIEWEAYRMQVSEFEVQKYLSML